MKMGARLVCVWLLCSVLTMSQGCLPVLIGGAFYHDAKKKKTRQEFIESFRQTNLEREKAGLEPLDLCTEKYGFDRAWAMKDPGCRERIKRYEAGDRTALKTGDGPTHRTASSSAKPDMKRREHAKRLEADIRLVSTKDGRRVASASGGARLTDMRQLAKHLAQQLLGKSTVRNKRIAVARFANRNELARKGEIGWTLAEMVDAELSTSEAFVMMERLQLSQLDEEKLLNTAGLVHDPQYRHLFGSLDYLVVGGVTVLEEDGVR